MSPSYPRPSWPIPMMASNPTATPSPSPPLNMATPMTSSTVPAPIPRVRCPSSKAETGKNAHSQWALVGIAPNLAHPPFLKTSAAERVSFARSKTDVEIHRPVGSGKTALMLALCLALRDTYSIAAVTNDIFTRCVPPPFSSPPPPTKRRRRNPINTLSFSAKMPNF